MRLYSLFFRPFRRPEFALPSPTEFAKEGPCMNVEIRFKKLVLTLFVALTGVPLVHAQLNNSCTYSYSFGKGQSAFGFCLTPYGTLASLQGSSGDNLLDPANPIEGWVMCDESGYGFFQPNEVIPGLGLGGVPPSVTQPKGPGKLPILFGNGEDSDVAVTANPKTKSVTFTMHINKIGGDGEFAMGPVTRIMGLASTGAAFSTSNVSAFGYVAPGDLAEVSGSVRDVGRTEPGTPGISIGAFHGYDTCYANIQPNSAGQGFIYDALGFYAGYPETTAFSYTVF